MHKFPATCLCSAVSRVEGAVVLRTGTRGLVTDTEIQNISCKQTSVGRISYSLHYSTECAAVREDIKLPTPSNISSVQFRYTYVRCGSEVTVIVELVSESEI